MRRLPMRTPGLAILLIAGCGSTGGNNFPRDLSMAGDLAGTADMSGGGAVDMSGGGAADMSGGAACTATADYGALGKKSGQAQGGTGQTGDDFITWQAKIDGKSPPDGISVELYGNLGVFKGMMAPKTGTFQLSGDE